MAEFVLKDAMVLIGTSGTYDDISTAVQSVTVNYSADLQDRTGFQGGGGKARIAGLKDWSMAMDIKQDHASTTIDALAFVGIGSTGLWIRVRPTNDNRGTTNPDYIGFGIPESYSPLSGNVGDLAKVSITYQCFDGAALVRETSAT